MSFQNIKTRAKLPGQQRQIERKTASVMQICKKTFNYSVERCQETVHLLLKVKSKTA